MKRVFGSITAVGTALWMFIVNAWEYLPAWVQAWWRLGPLLAMLIPALVVVGLVITSVHFRFNDTSTYEARQAAKLPPVQKQRVDVLTAAGYAPKVTIDLGTEGKATVLTRKPPPPPESGVPVSNLNVVDVAVVTERGETKMKAAVLYDSSSWAKDSATHFAKSKDTARAREVLANELIASAVKDAKEVFCFGLASSEPSSENERLSERRAQELCVSLAKLGFVNLAHQEVYAVPLGVSIDASTSGEILSRQRAAVIVGVQESYREMRLDHYITALTKVTHPFYVDLDRYKRGEGIDTWLPGAVMSRLVQTNTVNGPNILFHHYSADKKYLGYSGWGDYEPIPEDKP